MILGAGILLLALPRPAQEASTEFAAKGRVVCLAEEMKARHGVDVPPVHDHVWGFRVAKDGRCLTLVRTGLSKPLFVDTRLRGRDLRLVGRVFPKTSILDVVRIQWMRDGVLREIYYWCDICAIKGWDPDACACCQADVELRDEPAKSD